MMTKNPVNTIDRSAFDEKIKALKKEGKNISKEDIEKLIQEVINETVTNGRIFTRRLGATKEENGQGLVV